jgi:hypothetical protein
VSVYRKMLRLGGYLNLAIALAHLLLPVFVKPIGPLPVPAWAETPTGRVGLYLLAVVVAAFVGVLGLYGLSGGGRIRRLPFLRAGLLFTGALFLGDLVQMAWAVQARSGWQALARPSVVPFGLLGIGLLYTVGTIGLWKELRPARLQENAHTGVELQHR